MYTSSYDPFSLQYTALILTLLSFIIGAFAGHAIRNTTPIKKTSSVLAELANADNKPVLSEMKYNDLFVTNGSVDQLGDLATTVLSVMRSHDLRLIAEIGVMSSENESESKRADRAMERARLLTDFLVDNGVPVGSLEIYSLQKAQPYQAKISFSPEFDDRIAK